MSPRLQFAIEIAEEAGRTTLAEFGRARAELKIDGTPVTAADRAAERLLRERIALAFPEDGVLGEEEAETGGTSSYRWVLDPIDGTKSFACGVPLFATLIGCEHDGEPILGVARFAALDATYYAETGSGAFVNGEPCRCAGAPMSELAFCIGGLPKLRDRDVLEAVLELGERAMALRTWCDAFGHMMVASGRAAAMIDPAVSRWDVSGVSVIVRESGASFVQADGDPGVGDSAVSAIPGVLENVLAALRSKRAYN